MMDTLFKTCTCNKPRELLEQLRVCLAEIDCRWCPELQGHDEPLPYNATPLKIVCKRCNDTGLIPTDQGRQLLRMLEAYYKGGKEATP